ncbi:MAG: glutamate 5-kinase [Henriciella sp.]
MTGDYLADSKRLVVKIGSALVANDDKPRHAWLELLAKDIETCLQRGQEIVLVSSGAVALGRRHLGTGNLKKLEEKQAAAAVGQPLLMAALSDAFASHKRGVAQVLLTIDETENRRRWLNARATLDALLAAKMVPVINENDSVATDELRYGDNDRLAARVAQMVGADLLILLSDIDGLYSSDPRRDPDARHIPFIDDLSADYDQMAGGRNATAGVGSGGMVTKLAAAKIAWTAGCRTAITIGDRDHPLMALSGAEKATWIVPPTTPETARQAWLSGHLSPEGKLIIDAGAASALQSGASLLAVGVIDVEGQFERGAAVEICRADGQVIGKGLTAYGTADIQSIAGLQSDAMANILGYRGRPAIVHRDDIVLGNIA